MMEDDDVDNLTCRAGGRGTRRERFSVFRVSQEGTAQLRSLNPAEVCGDESEAGTDPQSLVTPGCSELMSFPKTHLAAQ